MSAAYRRGGIEHQPIEPELAHGFDERVEIHRLAHIAVDAELIAGDDVALFVRRGEDGYRQQRGAGIGAQALQDLQAVDLGQLEIEQDQLRLDQGIAPGMVAGAKQIIQRLGAIARDDDLVQNIALAQRAQRKRLVVRIVFHQ